MGNAGNITAYWKGYTEYAADGIAGRTPRMWGFQASLFSAPIVRGEAVKDPSTIATAIRIGNPASWKFALAARDESGGFIDEVTDCEILRAYRLLAAQEGVFVEPASAASVAGLLKAAEQGKVDPGQRIVCTVTGKRAQGSGLGRCGRPQPVTVPVDAAAGGGAARTREAKGPYGKGARTGGRRGGQSGVKPPGVHPPNAVGACQRPSAAGGIRQKLAESGPRQALPLPQPTGGARGAYDTHRAPPVRPMSPQNLLSIGCTEPARRICRGAAPSVQSGQSLRSPGLPYVSQSLSVHPSSSETRSSSRSTSKISYITQLKESHRAMAGPAFRAAAVRVRVPATSANLGPGFDAFGLSLGLYDDVVVRVADSGLHIDIAGEGSETLPRDENHLLVRSLRTAFDLLGGQPRGLEIVCANRIPHGRGLRLLLGRHLRRNRRRARRDHRRRQQL